MGRKKVYIIVNAEELAQDAGDRLLKTLEEPPPFVLFLLTAVERGAVFPTIVSRCQEIRLRPAARAELAGALVATGAEPSARAQLAALLGRPAGLGALGRCATSALFEQQQAYVQELVGRAGRLADRAAGARRRRLSERWTASRKSSARRCAPGSTGGATCVLHQLGLGERVRARRVSSVRRAGTQHLPRQGRDAAFSLQQALMDLDTNVNARLVLDLLVLKLPRP